MAFAQMIKHGPGTVHICQAQEHGGEARKHCSTGLMVHVVMGSSRVGQICDDRGRWECVCLLTDKHRFERPLSCDSSADQAGYNGAKLDRPVSPACSVKSKRTSALL
jgi:hypothetical protein